jgi:hypothetical protein
LSLNRLDDVVEKAARYREKLRCRAAVRPTPIDTKSFPFAEKKFGALELSSRVLQRLKEERLEVPTDVQVRIFPTAVCASPNYHVLPLELATGFQSKC